MWRILGTTVCIAAASWWGGAALAAAPCGERSVILERLAERFDETPILIALNSRGALVEIVKSERGSWTLLMTLPGGSTCIVMVGEAMETLAGGPSGPAS